MAVNGLCRLLWKSKVFLIFFSFCLASTVEDIRNIVRVKGLERDRLEAIINELREDGNLVHYVDEPNEVILCTDIESL